MPAGGGDRGPSEGARLTTGGTGVRRGGHQEGTRATGADIAQGVHGALGGWVASRARATAWAGGVRLVTALASSVGWWAGLDVDHALRGV